MRKQMLSMLGLVLLVLGFSMLFPMLLGFYDGDAQAIDFGFLGFGGMAVGFLLFKLFKSEGEIDAHSAYLLVALSWVVAGVFGAMPYLFMGAIPTFSQALFETISGFTTTGSTVIGDVEALPRSLLLWRSLTQWLGGMGIVVLFVALLSFYGNSGLKMYRAESTGPVKEKVVPRMRETAKILWLTYVIITVLQVIVLYLLKMPLFDSICHTFTTVATGGFSIKNNSFVYYDSEAIWWATTFFMAMCGVPFGLYYQAYKKRSLRPFLQNSEFRLYSLILVVASLICAVGLYQAGLSIDQALVHGAFQVSTLITTTGFMTADFALWPQALQFTLLIVMLVGGSAGSTAGGIKVGRILIMKQSIRAQFRKILHPQAVVSTKVDGRPIQQDVVLMVCNFLFLYITCLLIGTFVMTVLGYDIITAFSAALSAISNVGPALGTLGPTQNFSTVPVFGLYTLTFLMLAGRLELYTILILLTKRFWIES